MELLSVSLNSAKARRVVENGREYIVAPATLIVPGVLNGSQGALFYPPDEVAKNAEAWNGYPLLLNHPQDPVSGRHLSGSSPGIKEKWGLGEVRKAKVTSNGKLRAEGWFDVENVKRIHAPLLADLEAGRSVELSTGLYTNNERAWNGAHHNGKPYDFIARDYIPDHVAVLTNETGACSVRDGCGVHVVNRLSDPKPPVVMNVEEPDSVGGVFMTLLHAATSAHLLHLQTRSFAAHMALDELYKGLPGLTDDLIEAYQGRNGTLVTDYPGGFTPPASEPLIFVTSLSEWFSTARAAVGAKTELQNICDEIQGLIDLTLYKLRFLS